MIIYPSNIVIRNTENAFEIDDDDSRFIRGPTGLFAVYLGNKTALLLTSTETPDHWDIVTKIRNVHLNKLKELFQAAEELMNGYT
jgi:hypothetical protein